MLSNSLFLSPKNLSISLKTTNPNGCKRFLSCTARLQPTAGQRHYVLIHGACHGAWCWYKVSTLLKSAGHNVSALDLAASGVKPEQVEPLKSFSDYFEPLLEFMESVLAEERVIVVGHSMGGIGISLAMEIFPQKISAAVFASAIMPGPDLSLIKLKQERDKQFDSYMDTQFIFGNGENNLPTAMLLGTNFLSTMYQLSPAEDLVLATMLMRPAPFADYAGLSAVEFTKEKYGSVPRIYIVCDQDKIVKEPLQQWMIRNNPTDEVKVIAGSDHMVMFSKPKELCSCLLDIGNKYL